jgi:alpha-L-rhamnosidase
MGATGRQTVELWEGNPSMDFQAQWIWHPPLANMNNLYVHARREFALDSVPPQAVVLVTAGSLYRLMINGKMIGRGPNPSDPSRYYYDVHDVAEHLQAGQNIIAAACYNYGPESRGIIGQNWGRGGLLLELRESRDGKALVMTDDSWRVIQAPEWDQNAPINCTLLADYKETIDTRLGIDGWEVAGFDDSEWLEPEVLGPHPMEPYTTLVEREIPFLSSDRVMPANAYWDSASVTYAWRDDWEVYHDQRLVPGTPEFHGEKPVEVTQTHEDFTPAVMVDFGRLVSGIPRIEVRNSAGGTVDVLYGEGLHLTRVDRFVLRGGPQVLEPYNRRTFRYMKLLFAELPGRLELERVSVEQNTYPVEYVGHFECSDPLLNRIWDVGRYTMQMSMLDHFVDCPWRERTIYGGDVYAENLIAYYAFGDPRLNRKTLRQMFAIQHPEGALPPYGPYRGCDSFYPSWSGFFGLAFVDHYALTGDIEFLHELWDPLRRLLEWTLRELDRNGRPLIGDPREGGLFDQWMASEKTRYSAWSNFPFVVLLERAAALARGLGRHEQAEPYAEGHRRMVSALREQLDPETGLFQPLPKREGRRPGQYDNGLLLWSGILSQEEADRVAARLTSDEVDPINSPFHGLFVTEGLLRYGHDRQAVEFMREFWGEMLERGATTFWEHFTLDSPPGLVPSRGVSLCHGWSAGPTYSLPARVLGVTPESPGFARVKVRPQLADLDCARGSVPTPAGTVNVSWERNPDGFGIEVELPEGCEGRLSLPCLGDVGRTRLDGERVTWALDADRCEATLSEGRHRLHWPAR